MGIDAWFRGHPLLIALVGAIIVAVGFLKDRPIVIVVGAVVVLIGLARAFLFR